MHLIDHRHTVHIDGAGEQRTASGKRLRLVPVVHGRCHDAVDAFGEILRHMAGDHGIHAKGKMLAVLLGGTDRHNNRLRLRRFDFRPSHMVHSTDAAHDCSFMCCCWVCVSTIDNGCDDAVPANRYCGRCFRDGVYCFEELLRKTVSSQMWLRSLSVFSWERIMATSATAATATMYQAGAMLEPVA